MKITCCKCNQVYPFKPYESREHDAVIMCPYCGEIHSVQFESIKSDVILPIKELTQIRLATYYYISDMYSGMRYANASGVDQSNNDNANISNRGRYDVFHIAIHFGGLNKDPTAASFELDFNDDTDNPTPSWTAVGSATEIQFARSGLQGDDTSWATGNFICADTGDTGS